MASYEKRNDTWTVRYRTPDGCNKRLSGFKTKKEAELAYFLEQSKTKSEISVITLEELYELFKEYKRQRIKESSYISFNQAIEKFILPYFGKKNIDKITTFDIANWQNAINKTQFKFETKRKFYNTFRNLMNYAVEFHGLPINVVSKVGNFVNKELKKKINFWTDKEFSKFISVVDDLIYKAFFSTLYLTGARKGEAMGLMWRDVNFEDNIISINKTYTNNICSSGYKLTTTKTRSSTREIVIPNVLSKLLLQLKEYYSGFDDFDIDCFVFGMRHPLSPTTIDRRKDFYCKKSGVKNIRIHDFRHSHASLLLNKEQNILLVAQRLGHADINMTLNTYSHLFPNKQAELMNSLNINLE